MLGKKCFWMVIFLLLASNVIAIESFATISGKVTDEKNNLLQNIPLKIICQADNVPKETDDVGFFTIENVSFGTCEINAIVGKKVITQQVLVNESKHYIVNLKLEDAISTTNVMFFVIAVLVLAVIVYFALRVAYRKGPKVTKKQKDIRETLSKSEKMIVDKLCVCDNLTQSQLRHQTGLPKSTLHRVLTKLQNKNIIIYQEESGIKKVKLTEFFRK